MKKYVLIFLILLFFINVEVVSANIICNDGTVSPSCADCHQGCCSHHGGCASSRSYTPTYNNPNNNTARESNRIKPTENNADNDDNENSKIRFVIIEDDSNAKKAENSKKSSTLKRNKELQKMVENQIKEEQKTKQQKAVKKGNKKDNTATYEEKIDWGSITIVTAATACGVAVIYVVALGNKSQE